MKISRVSAVAVVCAVLASCAGDAEPEPPVSLALVEPSITIVPSTGQADGPTTTTAGLPEGLEVAHLPELLGDRLTEMNEWLRRHEPALNSGHGPHSADSGGAFSVEQFINTMDRDEAERLCPLYVAASEYFAGSTGSPDNVVLTGWALGDEGLFFDPGWTAVSCNLED